MARSMPCQCFSERIRCILRGMVIESCQSAWEDASVGFRKEQSNARAAVLGRGRAYPQNFRFCVPPPEDRQLSVEPAHLWQNAVGSVTPPFGAAAMSPASQLKKQ